MTEGARRGRKRLIIILSAFYLFTFLIFYVPNYVIANIEEWSGPSHTVYLAVRTVAEKLLEYFAPVAVAVLLFATELKIGKVLLGSIKPVLPVLIYSLPYCYLYALSEGFDSIDGTLISLGMSTLGFIAQWLHVLLLYFVARAISTLPIYAEEKASLPPMRKSKGGFAEFKESWIKADSALPERLTSGKIFDFDNISNRGVFAAAAVDFGVRLIIEIVSTVIFIVKSEGSFSTGEVITMILSYAFILCELILIYVVCARMKNKILTPDEKDGEANKKETENGSI